MRSESIVCWEATNVNDPMLKAAGELYEQTLPPNERIPWGWIEKSVADRARPVGWRKHLLLAAPAGRTTDPGSLAGYAYGAYIPGYGGYLCYIGVSDRVRRAGVGTTLLEGFFRAVAADAKAADESLPFVIWESHRPGPDAPADECEVWAARVRLFDRVGAMWVEGVDFLTRDYAEADADPIPFQLFVKPMDRPAAAFGEARLRGVIDGLHERVYRNDPGDDLYERTLTPESHPRLLPARLAAGERAVLV